VEIPYEKEIRSLEDSRKIADELSALFQPGDVVLFNGELGTGKTTLIKYICSNYSISDANSPSFSIVNEYWGDIKVYHFDFYRLEKLEELYDIGFEDYLNDTEAIVFIEWGSLMPAIIPESHFEINLQFSTPELRLIKILKIN
jgi:tRNA threonylcarbamoyladenosine biosynthesis protein TsaE